ncbi:hypothetical protein Q5P01_013384 [Channa striata]|uniref:SOWAHA-C winged helix-turn-helix domain-containing protein n=1 Tax=Channa striata TaxID=64152 RepID=A0AA88MP04_CHASR|nr:hypothetical protein Q5P01_013384 [Channa striata]
MASQCTEQAVLEFLMERGGRVQQMELIDHFLSERGGHDQSKEELDRVALTHIVDNVGCVKVENGVKFVCLNTGGNAKSVMCSDAGGHGPAECNGNIQETVDNSCDNGDGTGESSPLAAGLDNDKQSNGNEQHKAPSENRSHAGTSSGGGEVNLRNRRRRESAPAIGMPDLDQAQPGVPTATKSEVPVECRKGPSGPF